jgi:hypothetical protein
MCKLALGNTLTSWAGPHTIDTAATAAVELPGQQQLRQLQQLNCLSDSKVCS